MSDTRPIIGLDETILFPHAPVPFSIRAKIDTGARLSAIDVTIAERLGLKSVYDDFSAQIKTFKLDLTQPEILKSTLAQVVFPQLKQTIPQLADVQLVKAANGLSIRPYVAITFELSGKRITTTASIVDRSKLTFPMLVGKYDLKGFLIDPAITTQPE